jgi:hypothetical protein
VKAAYAIATNLSAGDLAVANHAHGQTALRLRELAAGLGSTAISI